MIFSSDSFLGAGNDQKARARRGVGRVMRGWGGGDREGATRRGRWGGGQWGGGQQGGRGKRWGGLDRGGKRETGWGAVGRGDFIDGYDGMPGLT